MSKNALETIIDEMRGCVQAGLFFGAISLGVSIPSVCASLSNEGGRSNGEDYKNWCKENLYPHKGFDLTSPEEIYSLRNGFTHQSRMELLRKNNGKLEALEGSDKVAFILSPGRSVFGENIIDLGDGQFYTYGIEEFCNNMGQAAIDWYENNKSNSVVTKNLDRMTNYRKFGDLDAIY